MVTVDNVDLTDYCSSIDVEWYDLSLESGRNARGNMRYNPVNDKYKIILHTIAMTQEQVQNFFSVIKKLKTYTVRYFNPYTGEYRSALCYRGDRKITMKWDRTDVGILYEPMDISLIEL